jgi:hypothetical protein
MKRSKQTERNPQKVNRNQNERRERPKKRRRTTSLSVIDFAKDVVVQPAEEGNQLLPVFQPDRVLHQHQGEGLLHFFRRAAPVHDGEELVDDGVHLVRVERLALGRNGLAKFLTDKKNQKNEDESGREEEIQKERAAEKKEHKRHRPGDEEPTH